MKKALIGAALALSVLSANAQTSNVPPVTITAAKDVRADSTGIKVGTTYRGIDANITHINEAYNRIGVGKTFQLWKSGPVAVNANGAAVYQSNLSSDHRGFGLVAGLSAEYAVNEQVSAVVGVSHFQGQERLSNFNGNTVTAGVKVRF